MNSETSDDTDTWISDEDLSSDSDVEENEEVSCPLFDYIPVQSYNNAKEENESKISTLIQTLNYFNVTVVSEKHESFLVSAIIDKLANYFKINVEDINWNRQLAENVLGINHEDSSMLYKDLIYILWKARIIPLIVRYNSDSKEEILEFIENHLNNLSIVIITDEDVVLEDKHKVFNDFEDIKDEDIVKNNLETIQVSLQLKPPVPLKDLIEKDFKHISPNIYLSLMENYTFGNVDATIKGYIPRKLKIPVLRSTVFEEKEHFFVTDDDNHMNIRENKDSNVVSSYLSIEDSLKLLKKEQRSIHFLKKLAEDNYEIIFTQGSILCLKNHLADDKICLKYEQTLYNSTLPLKILYGVKESGKTWFLKHLQRSMKKENYTVYLNVEDNIEKLNSLKYEEEGFIKFILGVDVIDEEIIKFAEDVLKKRLEIGKVTLLLDDCNKDFTNLKTFLNHCKVLNINIWLSTSDRSLEEELSLLSFEISPLDVTNETRTNPLFENIPLKQYRFKEEINSIQRSLLVETLNHFDCTILPKSCSSIIVTSVLKTLSEYFNFKIEGVEWEMPLPKNIADIMFVLKRNEFERVVSQGEALTYKDLLYIFCKIKGIPLVLDYDPVIKEDVSDLLRDGLSLVLLYDGSVNFDFGVKIFNNLSSISDAQLLQKNLEVMNISFQQKTPISLEDVIEKTSLQTITPVVYILLMTKYKSFGENIDAIKYYVPRKFKVPVLKKSAFITKDEDDLSNKPFLNELDEDYYEVIGSHGSVNNLRSQLVKDEISFSYESDLYGDFRADLKILHGPSGFGKTSFLKNYQSKLKPQIYTVYLNIRDNTNILNEINYEDEDFIDLLATFYITDEEIKPFCKDLVKIKIVREEMILILDDYSETFTKIEQLVDYARKLNIKVWIATEFSSLEVKLQSLALEMLPFDETDQILFLENFYKFTEADEDRRDELLTKIIKHKDDVLCDIFGHPMVIKALAQIFEFISDFDRDTISSFFVDNDEINDKSDVIRWHLHNKQYSNIFEVIGGCVEMDILEKIVNIFNININATDINNRTVIFYAIETENIDVIKWLLKNKVRVINQESTTGRSIYHYIASKGNVILAKLFKFDVKIEDKLLQTPLFEAVVSYKLEMVNWLLKQGSDVQKQNFQGTTVLHLAVEKGYQDIVEILLHYKTDVNSIDKNNRTALHLSILQSQFDITKLLLDHKADVNITDNSSGFTPLHLIALTKDFDAADILLKSGGDLSITDNSGRSPTFLALESGNLQMFEFFNKHKGVCNVLHEAVAFSTLKTVVTLMEDLDIDGEDGNGETPIFYAVANNRPEIVKFLIQRAANLTVVNRSGKSILHKAVLSGNVEIVEILKEYFPDLDSLDEDNRSLLYFAILHQKEDMVDWLIQNGADVNVRERRNDYGLMHLVASLGNTSIGEKLLQQNVDINLVNEMDVSPLCLAITNSKTNMVKWLISKNADMKKIGKQGKTTYLHKAAATGNVDICKILLEAGLDVNAFDVTNWTPLFYAADNKNIEAIKLLLNVGANITTKDLRNGKNVLHRSSENGYLEVVKVLLENQDLQIDVEDDNKWTSLMHAISNGRQEVVKFLLQKGANPCIDINLYGGKIAHWLGKIGNIDIAKLLIKNMDDLIVEENDGYSFLGYAMDYNNKNMVDWICNKFEEIAALENLF